MKLSVRNLRRIIKESELKDVDELMLDFAATRDPATLVVMHDACLEQMTPTIAFSEVIRAALLADNKNFERVRLTNNTFSITLKVNVDVYEEDEDPTEQQRFDATMKAMQNFLAGVQHCLGPVADAFGGQMEGSWKRPVNSDSVILILKTPHCDVSVNAGIVISGVWVTLTGRMK